MTVASILKGKGRGVISESASTSLAGICEVLAERKIGAIVITDRQLHIEGIISERDIVKIIGLKGPQSLDLPVGDIMTRSVITCRETDTINSVMSKMSAGRFRHMPVVDDSGKTIGVISIGDVVKHKIAQVELEAEQMRSYISTP